MNQNLKMIMVGSAGTVAVMYAFALLLKRTYDIDDGEIKEADLIFTRGANPLTLIEESIGYHWTHVNIYIGNRQYVDASSSDGVTVKNLDDLGTIDMEVMHIVGLTDIQRDNIVAFVNAQIGKPFNYTALNHISDEICYPKHEAIDSDSWYCSELVWAAYKYIGIDLDFNDTRCIVTPQAIYDRLG